MSRNDSEDGARVLRALAFHIHKKITPADALTQCIEDEGRGGGGKHRKWRQPAAVLEAEGFVPALVAGELIGPEAAALLTVIEGTGDHRILSNALTALAHFRENQS